MADRDVAEFVRNGRHLQRIPIPSNAPIVGAHAFTHCAGVHTHAATQNAVLTKPLALVLFERKAGHAQRPGEIVVLESDRVMSHDNTAFIQKSFHETGAQRVWRPERVVIMFDHCVPAVLPAHALNHEQARRFVQEQGIEHCLMRARAFATR